MEKGVLERMIKVVVRIAVLVAEHGRRSYNDLETQFLLIGHLC
jgi:hypothetical protein